MGVPGSSGTPSVSMLLTLSPITATPLCESWRANSRCSGLVRFEFDNGKRSCGPFLKSGLGVGGVRRDDDPRQAHCLQGTLQAQRNDEFGLDDEHRQVVSHIRAFCWQTSVMVP